MTVIPIRRRRGRYVLGLVVVAMYLVLIVGLRAWSSLGTVAFLGWLVLPTMWRGVRPGDATVEVGDGRVVVRHPGVLRAPVQIGREDLAAIVPLWLRPPDWRWWHVQRSGVRPSSAAPLLGDAGGPRRDALAFVLRSERTIPQARARGPAQGNAPTRGVPVRALLVAVEDLEEAQRPFLGWGLLSTLSDEAWRWIHDMTDEPPRRAGPEGG